MRKLVVAVVAMGTVVLSGTAEARVMIQNKGSDTLVNVAQAWAEKFQKVDSNVVVAVSGGGSGTGIAALINGTVDLANASRMIKDKEIKRAQSRGINPVAHVVGFDALAVFVHKDNPLDSVVIPQLADVYGEGGQTNNWKQLGVNVPGCQGQEMILISRQNNSGTYAYFRKTVLGKKRDFILGTRDMHGSKDVVDLVEHTPCAIGYSGLAYATSHVKMLKIKKDANAPAIMPSVATAVDKSYPIARPLFMYTNGQPKGVVKQYLDWIMSDEGQCIILEKGYAPARSVTCN
ncbi:MAG: phosphate ABC transporter substrate-binding protein [Magnetococcales bacterium]|nr:phosphate ABC transporter substrate-binding protein [Magnetococcales bacterium]